MPIELSRSRKTYLGKSAKGRDKFSLDVGIAPIVMREIGKEWEDIKPELVQEGSKWVSKGTPYRIEFDTQGGRRVYPDRTDLTKYLEFPAISLFSTIPKTIEAKEITGITALTAKSIDYDCIFGLDGCRTTFSTVFRKEPLVKSITFNVNAVGFDVAKLLKPDSVPRIPRPRLIDSSERPIERILDWVWNKSKKTLSIALDFKGLIFPVTFKNVTITPDPIVGASEDDGYEIESSGNTSITSGGVACYSGNTSALRYWGGVRFVSAEFPVGGTTITTLKIGVVPYSTSYDDANGNIHLEELAAPATFTAGAGNYNITGRDRTEASVSWIADGLGASRVWSPELAGVGSPAEEIWITDNLNPTAVVVIFRPNTDTYKTLYLISYDGSTTNCATLHIEWEEAGGEAWEKNLSDSFGVVDAIRKTFTTPKAESLTFTDAISKEPGLIRADSIAIADTPLKTVELGKADSFGITDSFARLSAFVRPLPDTLAISDTFAKLSTFVRSLSDNFTLADSIAMIKFRLLVLADSFGITDVLAKTATKIRSDSVAIADFISKTIVLNKVEGSVEENFDGLVAGAINGQDGWVAVTPGATSAEVSIAQFVSAPNSLRMYSPDNTAFPQASKIFLETKNKNIIATMQVYFGGAALSNYIHLRLMEGGAVKLDLWYKTWLNQLWNIKAGGATELICSVSRNTFHTFRIRVKATNYYELWIDDDKKGAEWQMVGNMANGIDSFLASSENAGMANAQEYFIDDIIFNSALGIVDFISKAMATVKTDAFALTDTLSKTPKLIKADTVAIADSAKKIISLAKSETLIITDVLSKAISIVKADIMAITDTFTKYYGWVKNLADIITITDSLIGIHRVKQYLRVQVSRMGILRMSVSKLDATRLGVSRMPLFRWIIRRFTA